MYCVENGSLEALQLFFLSRDVLANLLPLSLKLGRREIIEYLCSKHEININQKDNEGVVFPVYNSPLIIATIRNDQHSASLLCCRRDLDLNERDNNDCTALRIAAELGRHELVCLISQFARTDVNAADRRGVTPLISAAENGFVDIVRLLCGTQRIILDCCDETGFF
jgi:ankyrin repeat protein